MKTVYIAMSGDIIHHGHLNIINEGRNLGKVIIGLHTDDVIAGYWRKPIMSYEERKMVIENIKGVSKVIPQDTLDQVANIKILKPDYILHGDDWKSGFQNKFRKRIIDVIKEWDGKLVEIKYTEGISITKLEEKLSGIGTTPQMRMKKLKELMYSKKIVRILEAHNGLTGLIVEKTKVEKEGKIKEFDGMWVSSLCDSTSKGKPDIEVVDLTSRLNTINDILEVTTKPIILDGDTGGKVEHFVYTVKTLERLGVSAIIIEDKIGLKKNSLFGTDVEQKQDTVENFCSKIRAGRNARVTNDFMIIARIESLITKAGLGDALFRAKAYIQSGADGIMIHSKESDGKEIIEFCKQYSDFENKVPLIVVPTSYNFITEEELSHLGVNVVIYANHLIRSAYPAMMSTAKSILENERSKEASENCMAIKEILTLIPGGK
ncbi:MULTISPECIES: phosphoenolpyruvate mutase [Clostridium]|uniref:phosphoenolpyruvate mutase n=1 Tax=Clostridium aquiflavi TaxID=3073603 RepID=A0ABU1EFT1_9CLOT|nr:MULTISPECIES: phosphoenolpyruvate mutase [unclassified Clostridium]MDR5586967.1 phosphoenolpyruvate mutase [Clostridium sp. 5N-1]NFG60432.1 phosphoenolpyruvate mutase [Clostridium botulinum]NFQ09925.1 phosphoenolpyruvate mutase [Clostridium botulinum]